MENKDPLKDEKEKQALALTKKRKSVADLLERMKGQIQNALPKFITPERMIRVAITAMSRTPKLLECDQTSLIGAIITASQLGLMPDGVLGEAYMIPFKVKGKMQCQFMIGYRGYIALALRSGQVKSIQARAVKKSDEFHYEFGLEPKLTHLPKSGDDTITHFYAVIQLMTGGTLFEVMTCDEINFIRDKSKAYAFAENKKETIWHINYEEMGKKTVIRRLVKIAPLSPEINRAAGLDDLADVEQNQKTNLELLEMPEFAQEVTVEIVEDETSQASESNTSATTGAGTKATNATLNAMKEKELFN